MASLLFGPKGRTPDYAIGENRYAHAIGAQTAVLVANGGGYVHTVTVGVVGTLAKFYDVKSGGTTDATTLIHTANLSAATLETNTLDFAFSQGLTVIITGDASTEVTITFRAEQSVSPRTFGTQLDGNAGRAQGTSTDKAMAS